jgi:predicted dehydrogenase
MTLQVGLIGCGNVVSYGHRPALTTLDDVELVALADVTPARLKIGQEWFGLNKEDLYTDYQDVIAREDVEAVVVTVPQQFRREIVLDALASGKHVLSEKPIAYSSAVAHELIKAADDAGLVLGMVHNYHYLPEYSLIKQLLDAGTIGKTRVITMQYMGVIDYPGAKEYKSDWRHTMASGGGVLTDMIHGVYLAEWLAESHAQQVMAFVDAPEYAHREPVIEDLALVQVAYENCYATIHMAWGEGVGGVDITGSEGHLRMRYNKYQTSGFNQPAELYTVDANWNRTDHTLDNLPTHMDNIARSFTELYADFRDAIAEKRPTVAPGAAGVRALEVTLGAYLSGLTGHVVTLPLETDHPVYQQGIKGMADVGAWQQSRTKAAGLYGTRS